MQDSIGSQEEIKVVEKATIKKKKYKPSREKTTDLIHTKLQVSFDWEKQYLYGVANLQLKPYFYQQNQVVLDAKGFDVSYVQLVKEEEVKNLNFTYDSLRLTIELDTFYTKDEQYELEIKYVAKPNELTIDIGHGKGVVGRKGLYFINPLGKEKGKPKQIWTQGEPESASCWFPTIDAPNEKTTQELYITVDTTYQTISNGDLIFTRDNGNGTATHYWVQNKPHAPYLVMMTIGDFFKYEELLGNLEINYYVEKKYKQEAKAIFGNTPEMIQFFSGKLKHDFPWDKYSQVAVRDFVSGAMENTSASVFLENIQTTEKERLDRNWEFIIAHELFHQWFGDLVTCESWSHITLNEAFATYSEYLWTEHKYGENEADYVYESFWNEYLRESKKYEEPLIRYHYDHPRELFDSHSYSKGALVVRMLHLYVGDEAFWASLHYYLKEHSFSDVEVDELRLAFEDVTGKDLKWFFDQWFHRPGHPDIVVQQFYDDSTGVLEVNVLQLQEEVYQLPCQLNVWVKGNLQEEEILITQKSQMFEFQVGKKPDLVVFDPKKQILGLVTHVKSEEELKFQFEHEKGYFQQKEVVNRMASYPFVDTTFFKKALIHPFWKIREQSLRSLENKPVSLSMLPIIERMALKDSRSNVRKGALKMLLTQEDSLHTFLPTYQEAIYDSSYMVIGQALSIYLDMADEVDGEVELYERDTHFPVVSALANYYIKKKDLSKLDWFRQKFETDLKAVYQINFSSLLCQYLMMFDEQEQISFLYEIYKKDITGEHYYQRMARYRLYYSVAKHKDQITPIVLETVDKLRKRMREEETNPYLISKYQNTFEKNLE
ncbi:MAG: M1 family peptidase [Cytophagales bacterium]|nr:M1 family peptidase [Cytophagales bacterium]